jgi:tripeptidyl-peptidase-1
MQPTEETFKLVQIWLEENSIDVSNCEYSSSGDWVTLTLPVSKVEALLDTKYHVYKHDDGTQLVRTTSWSLPQFLLDHITTIQPTTAFLRANPKGNTVLSVPTDVDVAKLVAAETATNSTTLTQNCNWNSMTPRCLRLLYNTFSYAPQSLDKNKIGFTNYLGQVFNSSDTEIFLRNFRPEAVSAARQVTQIGIDGGAWDDGTTGAGAEASLDVQTILGHVYPTSIVSYSTGGEPPFDPDVFTPTNTNEPYLTWILFLLAQDPASWPNVISTSYGDDEQTVPQTYAETVCNQFAALTAQGISLIFSSGDFGVGDNDSCITNDGQNSTSFLPVFPASCPYVTAVGATKNYPEVVAFDARNGFSSGAGFSNYFPRPEWQGSFVQSYVNRLGNQFDGLYNRSGRAYPDIAAQGFRYLIFVNGSAASLDGTSASAPTVASIFSLVNDALIAKGKPTLGWLNPWLYSKGYVAFTDVVNGSAIGCSGPGFSAGPGWDAASGFGTPDFEKIREVLGV